jgi:hypothetical protein
MVYDDCARVERAVGDGAQIKQVRSALVVANDISFGCLKRRKEKYDLRNLYKTFFTIELE